MLLSTAQLHTWVQAAIASPPLACAAVTGLVLVIIALSFVRHLSETDFERRGGAGMDDDPQQPRAHWQYLLETIWAIGSGACSTAAMAILSPGV